MLGGAAVLNYLSSNQEGGGQSFFSSTILKVQNDYPCVVAPSLNSFLVALNSLPLLSILMNYCQLVYRCFIFFCFSSFCIFTQTCLICPKKKLIEKRFIILDKNNLFSNLNKPVSGWLDRCPSVAGCAIWLFPLGAVLSK